jgi:pyrroline-5-carboxylate reductase
MRIGFAGAGNMAGAMARGWAGAEGGPDAMLFCDLDAARADTLADEVVGQTRASLSELATDSDVLVLAVKPGALDDVAGELGSEVPPLVSILGGVRLERIESAFPGAAALRLMPNLPVETRTGVVCHTPVAGLPATLADEFVALLGALGDVVELDEGLFEAAMAVMSCSPAYLALFAEALGEAGIAAGLERRLALRLVTDAIGGTGALLRVRDPVAVQRAVASPGGATEQGLEALKKGGFEEAIQAAVRASMERFK